jgi:hypothetical protein
VYSAEIGTVSSSTAQSPETVRDASSIDWKPGMRAALALAVPAGMLSSDISPVRTLGIFWMAGAALWAVTLYMRSQRLTLMTMGAGARIGLVTGLIAGWLAFGLSGTGLFVKRVMLHEGNQIDSEWRQSVEKGQQMGQQWLKQMSIPTEATATQLNAQRNWMLSPEGHAGYETMGLVWDCALFILFAAAGGALGARMLAGRRRPEI